MRSLRAACLLHSYLRALLYRQDGPRHGRESLDAPRLLQRGPAWLFISIAVKWLTVGRYKAGRYPVWGRYYFRWWLATCFQSLGWPDMLVGTPLMGIFYRAMVARVGKNCVIGTPLCGAFDLVSIGDNSSVGRDAQLLGYRVENGWLMLGTVDIGAECFVGMHTRSASISLWKTNPA